MTYQLRLIFRGDQITTSVFDSEFDLYAIEDFNFWLKTNLNRPDLRPGFDNLLRAELRPLLIGSISRESGLILTDVRAPIAVHETPLGKEFHRSKRDQVVMPLDSYAVVPTA